MWRGCVSLFVFWVGLVFTGCIFVIALKVLIYLSIALFILLLSFIGQLFQ